MKFLLIFSIILMFGSANAQTQGEITFEDKMNLHKRMEGREMPEEIKSMIPEFRSENFTLQFTSEASVYKLAKDQNDEEMMANSQMGERRMMFRQMRANNVIFKDLIEEQKIEQKEFLGKRFLIIDSIDAFPWKIDPNMEEVAGFMCMKAIHEDTSNTTTVWFTQQIPVQTGPDRYGLLPGMILKVDINDGERTLTATEVNLTEMDPDLFKKPNKGKEVTEEEYQEIVREKMKEMGMGRPGGGPGRGPGFRVIRQ